MISEAQLYRWQQASQICITTAKPVGRPWTLRLIGTCCVTKQRIEIEIHDDTLAGVLDELLNHRLLVDIFFRPEARMFGLDRP